MGIIERPPRAKGLLRNAVSPEDFSTFSLADILRAWIEVPGSPAKGLGVRQIAEASGLPSSRVASALTGERVPTREELDMLCLALQLGREDREVLQRRRLKEQGEAQTQRLLKLHGDVPVSSLRGRPAPARPSGRGRRLRQPVPAFGQPDPIRVSSARELVQALKAVHVWGGSPSLRELEHRADGRLRRSTISDMLRGESLPDYDRYVTFLRACGVDGPSLETWVFVWRRLKALENPEVAPWLPGVSMP